ncbi:MAG: IclR family transcriptional regulator [Armatimonadota bacterium]|nr:IclR family transcriptional regulator [Armatimonadota bacterium]MDR7519865.1 IclR family transcriptional regulator [Armatimonadota bacterium]MDR7551286.1 IclR family transcriptional regulator [Armatimonadota bacterium]
MSRSTRGDVQSVERAMSLLVALGEADRPLSVRELSDRVSLPRPTVYRLLQTLQRHGAASATDGGFVVGPRILWLAAQRLEQTELRAVGRPFLLDLRDRTGETVHLAVLEQGQVVYVDKVESPGPMRMASAVGKIMPAHCTALGKAMLAHLPPAQVREILARRGMPRRTPQTITDPDRLFAELEAVRARGYAIDNVENEEGIRCVGAAVLDHQGRVAGAISLSGSARSLTLDRIRRDLGNRVRETAERVSRAMGWQHASPPRGRR